MGPQPGPRQTRILIVDDQPIVREYVEKFLVRAGYVVQQAGSGAEALARLEAEPFDLVITDNQMPGMSGAELAQAIKARFPSLPVLMFTGTPPDAPSPWLALVLEKPADIGLLVGCVRGLLNAAAGRPAGA